MGSARLQRLCRLEQGTARVVPPGDASALAGALSRVLADDGLADALVASGDQRCQAFSMHELARKYEALYEELSEDRPVERQPPGRSWLRFA